MRTFRRTRRSSRSSGVSPKFEVALQAVARALVGEQWYLFGAQAVALHGVPRTTADIDVTVAPPRAGIRGLMKKLRRGGFVLQPVGDVDSFVEATRILPFVHEPTQVSLDVVLSGPGLEEGIHARAVDRRAGSVNVRLIDVNDLLMLKVLAGRAKDLEDVAGLLRAAPKGIDPKQVLERLSEVERALDVSDLVPRLRALIRAQR